MADVKIQQVTKNNTEGQTPELAKGEYKTGARFLYPSNLGANNSGHMISFLFLLTDKDFKPDIGTAFQNNYNVIEANNPTGDIPKMDPKKDPIQQGEDIAVAVGKKALNIGVALAQSVATSDPPAVVGETICLYIPDTVNVSYSAQYEEIGLSKALGTPYFLAQAGVSAYEAYKSMKEVNIPGIANAVGNNPYAREAIGRFLGGIKGLGIDGEAVSKLLNRAAGDAFNPQLQVLFQGIDFRRFQFDFTFTPSTIAESIVVKEIIKSFKLAAAPEIIKAATLGSSMFYKVPDTVVPAFWYRNGQTFVQNLNVNKIGRCVIENVTVDYAPMGWATYQDGFPVQTKLSIQLKEIGIIDKEQIGKGY
jgi:hypothetical protein